MQKSSLLVFIDFEPYCILIMFHYPYKYHHFQGGKKKDKGEKAAQEEKESSSGSSGM